MLSGQFSVVGFVWLSALLGTGRSLTILSVEDDQITIPDEMCSPYGTYPNILNITESDQQGFFPVIIYPDKLIPVRDMRKAKGLATAEEVQHAKRRNSGWRVFSRNLIQELIFVITLGRRTPNRNSIHWAIGKYDENRLGTYTSELYDDTSNTIDGFGGRRTLHLGIDLEAPVGTKVFAFCDGIIHSAGYNAEFGDYGHVVVVEHHLEAESEDGMPRRVWALYGHMDKASIRGKQPGQVVRKGKPVGRVGDCHENGGWIVPHLHFQLSLHPPETHDMPGASSVQDRINALKVYPDPRYVLGAIY